MNDDRFNDDAVGFNPSHPSNSVSVVMPVFNGAKYIGETLDSVLAQTVPPTEVIVVNDGSTDDTASVVQAYGNRVTLLNVKNGGAAAARNIGGAAATGSWIALCDADDLWLPTKLEKQLRLANECPEVHCVLTDYTEITDGVLTKRSHFSYAPDDFWNQEKRQNGFIVRQSVTGKLSTFQPGITSTPMVKRDFYLQVGGFDVAATHWADDTCFHFRCLSVVPFGVVPEVLMYYRRHPDSLSANSLKQLKDGVTVWNYIIDRYPQAQPYRAELLQGVEMMRREVAEMVRYQRRQKIKRLLGFR
jgi:glycosyltransferase involved in cell wall biosynthesis